MSKKIDYFCAKLTVLNSNNKIILEQYVHKIPLAKKYYDIEGEKRIGRKNPCILERKYIENQICVESVSKLENGKVYKKDEVLWFFDLYNLDGDFIIVNY